jgi:hypothetical protein
MGWAALDAEGSTESDCLFVSLRVRVRLPSAGSVFPAVFLSSGDVFAVLFDL